MPCDDTSEEMRIWVAIRPRMLYKKGQIAVSHTALIEGVCQAKERTDSAKMKLTKWSATSSNVAGRDSRYFSAVAYEAGGNSLCR